MNGKTGDACENKNTQTKQNLKKLGHPVTKNTEKILAKDAETQETRNY